MSSSPGPVELTCSLPALVLGARLAVQPHLQLAKIENYAAQTVGCTCDATCGHAPWQQGSAAMACGCACLPARGESSSRAAPPAAGR